MLWCLYSKLVHAGFYDLYCIFYETWTFLWYPSVSWNTVSLVSWYVVGIECVLCVGVPTWSPAINLQSIYSA
jgi:hypothetical protein